MYNYAFFLFSAGAYDLSRQVVWIAVSTSILLFAPVMFEIERLNVEEMMKQDRNRVSRYYVYFFFLFFSRGVISLMSGRLVAINFIPVNYLIS